MSERDATLHDLLRNQVGIGRDIDGELLDARGQPRLQLQASEIGGVVDLFEHAAEQRPTHFEIRVQVVPFRRPHAVELCDRLVHRSFEHLHELRHHGGIPFDRPLAHRECLWKAQQISRRERALHDAPSACGLERG